MLQMDGLPTDRTLCKGGRPSLAHWLGKYLSLASKVISAVLLVMLSSPLLFAQSVFSDVSFERAGAWQEHQSDGDSRQPSNEGTESSSSSVSGKPADDLQGKQTKRILGMVPNFEAVSADTHLPPLTFKQKFWLATQGSFDYSSFVFVGMQAGVEEATNTYPEFHQGAAGFGRYYWHTFVDQASGNYFTGAIFAAITREDPRYYTLYHGGFLRRTEYAMSRVLITRNDKGFTTFNYSEVLGNGAATVIGDFYYPQQERGNVGEFFERWATQILTDAVGNIFTEFWPDINHKFFHEH